MFTKIFVNIVKMYIVIFTKSLIKFVFLGWPQWFCFCKFWVNGEEFWNSEVTSFCKTFVKLLILQAGANFQPKIPNYLSMQVENSIHNFAESWNESWNKFLKDIHHDPYFSVSLLHFVGNIWSLKRSCNS